MKRPYEEGMLDKPPIAEKTTIEAEVVCVLYSRLYARGLELLRIMTRAVTAGEVHEFIVTDEADAAPGSKVDRVAYLGFFKMCDSGILAVGDVVEVKGRPIGRIVGFDATHAPNHWNVVICAEELVDGRDLGLSVRDLATIRQE